VLGVFLVPRERTRSRTSPGTLAPDPRTLVILPTYNERETVGLVLDGLLALPDPPDILVVDDASPDGTAEVVRDRSTNEPRVRLIERSGKGGLAGAYLEGFRTAEAERYELIVEMDSDLSHDPGELPRLLTSVTEHDVVIGSRYVRGGSVTDWSRPRLALSRSGNLYARLALGFPLRDATSGFRVYRRAVLTDILQPPVRSDGYGFQVELVHRAWRRGYAVAEVPITFREREHGESKISRRIVLEALWLIAVWGLRTRLRPS